MTLAMHYEHWFLQVALSTCLSLKSDNLRFRSLYNGKNFVSCARNFRAVLLKNQFGSCTVLFVYLRWVTTAVFDVPSIGTNSKKVCILTLEMRKPQISTILTMLSAVLYYFWKVSRLIQILLISCRLYYRHLYVRGRAKPLCLVNLSKWTGCEWRVF